MSTIPQKIVFLGMPRCGSNFVCTAVDNHPEFVVHGELFMPRQVGALRGTLGNCIFAKQELSFSSYRDRRPEEFLDKVLMFDETARFAGFKLFFSHNPTVLDYVLSFESGFKKIHIKRDNLLAMYSSRQITRKTNQAHVTLNRKNEVRREKVAFSKESFLRYLEKYNNYTNERLQALRGRDDFLEVTYEEFRRGDGFRHVFDFLGADARQPVRTRMAKINSDAIAERFINPDDVRRCLEELGHEEWAWEDGTG